METSVYAKRHYFVSGMNLDQRYEQKYSVRYFRYEKSDNDCADDDGHPSVPIAATFDYAFVTALAPCHIRQCSK